VAQFQWAQVTSASEPPEAIARGIARQVGEVVDDWCATPPRRRWPLPWPPPVAELRPLDLLLAGAQFQRAANALDEHPLHDGFEAAADQLFAAGLERLQERGEGPRLCGECGMSRFGGALGAAGQASGA
jgi:hypothetical protein